MPKTIKHFPLHIDDDILEAKDRIKRRDKGRRKAGQFKRHENKRQELNWRVQFDGDEVW